MLFLVEDSPQSPLGPGPGRRAVVSRRSAKEKQPWKSLPALRGDVEEQFVFRLHLGETVAPFRCREPLEVVVPWLDGRLLDADDEQLDEFPGLARWWRTAVELWETHRATSRLSLLGQLDYMGKLRRQFPVPSQRVVYSKGGMYLAASSVADDRALVDHTLYWAAVSTAEEGHFLAAVFNSPVFTSDVSALQARGEHNPRHFDKHIFQQPIPTFDPVNSLHSALVDVAVRGAAIASAVEVTTASFESQRRRIRSALVDAGVASDLDQLVRGIMQEAGKS